MFRNQRQRQWIKAAFSPKENIQEIQVKEGEKDLINSLWIYYPQAISLPGGSGQGSQGAAGKAAGVGGKRGMTKTT